MCEGALERSRVGCWGPGLTHKHEITCSPGLCGPLNRGLTLAVIPLGPGGADIPGSPWHVGGRPAEPGCGPGSLPAQGQRCCSGEAGVALGKPQVGRGGLGRASLGALCCEGQPPWPGRRPQL